MMKSKGPRIEPCGTPKNFMLIFGEGALVIALF